MQSRRTSTRRSQSNSSKRKSPCKSISPADTPGSCGLLHRHRVAGSDHPGPGAGTARLQPRLVRARRAYGLAHPSARPDLYVISGVGRVQAKGGPVREIRPGDVVWIRRARSTGMALAEQRHDPHRHAGSAGRQRCHLDGARHRRRVQRRAVGVRTA